MTTHHDLDEAPITIPESRRTTASALGGAGVTCAAILVKGVLSHETWTVAGFSLLLALLALAALRVWRWPSQLTIQSSGLTLTALGRDRVWRWSQVRGFHVDDTGPPRWYTGRYYRRRRNVAFASDGPPMVVGARRSPPGGYTSLPGNWAIDEAELADLLNAATTRWA